MTQRDTSKGPAARAYRRVSFAILPILGLSALLGWGLGPDPGARTDPSIGRPAPSFVLATPSGGRLSSSELAGRVLVVNFFASDCAACRIEHPALLATAERYDPIDVAVLGVAFLDDPGRAIAFHRSMGGGWPVAIDPRGTTAIDFGVAGIPETFVIGRDGTIRHRFFGAVSERDLTAVVAEAVGAGGSG